MENINIRKRGLNSKDLEKAFRLGLGRAYIHVKEHGDDDLQDIILRHCLKNPCYDPQCEDARASWLMSVIDLCDHPEFYHDKIIKALSTEKAFWSLSQLFDLCLILAKKENKAAEEAIFNRFDKQDFEESWQGMYEIVDLKGLDGLTHIAKMFGRRIIEEENFWDGGLYSNACEMLGEKNVNEHLKRLSKDNSIIAVYFKDAIDSHEKRTEPYEAKIVETLEEQRRRELPINKILTDIEQGKFQRSKLMRFGKVATDKEIGIIYNKILEEKREKQLTSYLWIFGWRDLPALNEKIIELVYSDNKMIRQGAIYALSRISNHRIHDLAVSLHYSCDPVQFSEALELFIHNYKSNDHKYIERVLIKSDDLDFLHDACTNILKVFEENPTPDMQKSILWVYENTPCAYCRSRAVELLFEHNIIPANILNECHFDCAEDTINIVKNSKR